MEFSSPCNHQLPAKVMLPIRKPIGAEKLRNIGILSGIALYLSAGKQQNIAGWSNSGWIGLLEI